MKLVVQRVKYASVKVDEKIVGKIDNGFMVLVGITDTDSKDTCDQLADKLIKLRVFDDENGVMNKDIKSVNGKLLLISQFTLYADLTRGNRPSYFKAAKPEISKPLYDYFCDKCESLGINVERGIFGADMKVELLNDGPVTIIMEKQTY